MHTKPGNAMNTHNAGIHTPLLTGIGDNLRSEDTDFCVVERKVEIRKCSPCMER